MSERFASDHEVLSAPRVAEVLDLASCAELQALLNAARTVDAEAEDLQWTRVDPVELPGLRRAAQLLRLLAATHVEAGHGRDGDCQSAARGAFDDPC